MALPTLEITDTPDDLLAEHVHCLTTMSADPLAKPLAQGFAALITDWNEVGALRVQALVDVAQAAATAFYLDLGLNRVVDDLVLALEAVTEDRSDPLWKVYLKGQDPSSLKRPTLKGQLAAMSVWPESLSASPHPELKAIGDALAPLIPPATAAETALAAARQHLVEFKNVGRFRQHIDKSNATRASAYGTLLDLPHDKPELKLPADYADRFFLHDVSRRGASKPKSAAEIDDEIKALQDKLTALEKSRAEAVAREQAEGARTAAREEQEQQLADLKLREKDARAQRKALEKSLGKKK